jgi:hypothetical protein
LIPAREEYAAGLTSRVSWVADVYETYFDGLTGSRQWTSVVQILHLTWADVLPTVPRQG